MDTVENQKDWGSFCEKRGNWLKNKLEECGNSQVYIFMHHPPFNIGIPALDRIKIKNDYKRIEKH